MVVAFIGGYALGSMTTSQPAVPSAAETPAEAERRSVPVGLSPTMGSDEPLVTIVEFSDFQCPYCSRHVHVRHRLMEEYGDRVRWVFKHYPLEKLHPRAVEAAEASMAAHAQGRFWDYTDKLFMNQRHFKRQDLLRYAREIGLDADKIKQALENGTYAAVVAADKEVGRKLGVSGTPNMFINGRWFPRVMRHAQLESLVRQELAHARKLMAQGVAQEDLYREITTAGQRKGAGEGTGEATENRRGAANNRAVRPVREQAGGR
jgi:protein-disulfide isomerase